jgi:hypothetical protein
LVENTNFGRRRHSESGCEWRKIRRDPPFPKFGTALVILPATAAMADTETKAQGVTTMFNMSEIKQGLVAAVAALVLTATAVGAAVGPAEMVQGPVLAAAQLDVSARA